MKTSTKYLLAMIMVLPINVGISFAMAKMGAPTAKWLWCEMLKVC